MYRSQFEIDNWLNHFQNYLDTGTFDPVFYWIGYNSIKDDNENIQRVTVGEVTGIPMVLKRKLWDVHSPEMNKFMKVERLEDPSMGFKRVPRP